MSKLLETLFVKLLSRTPAICICLHLQLKVSWRLLSHVNDACSIKHCVTEVQDDMPQERTRDFVAANDVMLDRE